MNYLKFSLFGSLKGTESKVVSVDEIIRLIKHDDSVAQKTDLYRQMAQNVSRETAKKEIKEKVMPAFSVGVVFKSYGRKLSDVEHATGLALCDLDKTPSNSPCLGENKSGRRSGGGFVRIHIRSCVIGQSAGRASVSSIAL